MTTKKLFIVHKTLFPVIFLSVTSCSSMINPHINIGDRPTGATIPLNKAIDYANGGKDKYTSALGDQAKFNSYLGIGLTALGAAALGLGMTGGGTVPITVLGLTGASAYGIGSFLENRPRQRAYILGYNALNCAVEAVLPLNIEKSRYNNFSQELMKLPLSIKNTQSAIFLFKNANPNSSSDILSGAETLVETAKIAYRNGDNLNSKIFNSGQILITATDRIVGNVNQSIVSNQANLQSIVAIIGQLGGIYSQLTTVPKSQAPVINSAASRLTPELTELIKSVNELSPRTQKVTELVNYVVEKKPLVQLKLCGVNPEDIASDIEIEPAGVIGFTQGQERSRILSIKGGNSPYAVKIETDSTSGVTVIQEPFASTFIVKVSDQAVKGDYSIFVTDLSQHNKFVTVRIK